MRLFLVTLIPFAAAFTTNIHEARIQTKLELGRRDAVYQGAAVLAGIAGFGLPQISMAAQGFDKWINTEKIPKGGKLDLNNAFADDYNNLKDMDPSAANKLASNAPYKSVKDIYKIKNLSDRDVKMFKNNESIFTVNPYDSKRGQFVSERGQGQYGSGRGQFRSYKDQVSERGWGQGQYGSERGQYGSEREFMEKKGSRMSS